jgi:dienelactone hydrolase
VTRRRTALVLASAALIAGCTGGSDDDADAGPSSSTPSSTAPASTTSAPRLPIVSSTWDDGIVTLSDGAPTRDWGVVAAPDGAGPYPVVLLLHGNHPTCPTDTGGGTWPCPEGTENPNHEGLAYLAEALAERGFVAVAPGINVQYTFGAGEPMEAARTAEIAERTLARLEAGELGVDPGLLDLDRLVAAGHSVGGQDAGLLAGGLTSFERDVQGVVLLQPALNVQPALPLVDVPAVVLLSECDGDTGVVGGQYITHALDAPRTTPAALVVLERGNHNFTNTLLRGESFPVNAPACDPGARLPAEEQQAFHAAVVPELVHAVLADGQGEGWAGSVFDEPEVPAGVLLGVVPADEPVAPVPGPGPDVPASVALDGFEALFCPFGYYTPFVEPGKEACHRPELPMFVGLPRTIALAWDEPGATLTLPVDATAGDVVRLRVAADVADARLRSPLELRLSSDTGASIELIVEVPEVRVEEAPPFTLTHGLVMWGTATLPLPKGASEVTLEVVGPDAGSLQIVSLGVQ